MIVKKNLRSRSVAGSPILDFNLRLTGAVKRASNAIRYLVSARVSMVRTYLGLRNADFSGVV